jgi:hypothetical protein
MFRKLLLAAAFVAALALDSRADDPAPPRGAPPTFAFINEVDLDKEEAISIDTVLVPVEEARVVKAVDPASGKVVERTEKVLRYVAEQRTHIMPLSELQVVTPAGKTVPKKEALKKLAGRVVVVGYDGIDPAYLKLFKDDTLILLPKAKAETEDEAPQEPGE